MFTSTAALELALVVLGAACGEQVRIVWRGLEQRDSVVPGFAFGEGMIVTWFAQGHGSDGGSRAGDVVADDVVAVWQWIVTLPQPSGAAPATYGAGAYERRMRHE